jgi:hypothetical protein
MKTIQRAAQLISFAICTGTIMLLATSAPAQNLFVADSNLGTVYEFTPSGARSTYASGLSLPTGLAFDSAGNLFVAEQFAGTIIKITPDGSQSTFASGLGSPRMLVFDSAGNLFEADPGGACINEFTPQGVKTTFASGLSNPWGLAFDNAGNLLVACELANEIVKITPGGVQSVFATGLNGPGGLALDSKSNLFVTTLAGGEPPQNLVKISSGGTQTLIYSGLDYPFGLAIDSSNNVFVAQNGNGTILNFGTGAPVIFASGLNSDGPYGMVFHSHPNFLKLQAAVTNGTFQLTVTMSSPSSNTIVQASTDLVSWTNIYTNMPPFTYTDSLAVPWRFYRGLLSTNN